jgi:hypothetical protein
VSDFDDVLERLLMDPGFKAALAADPDRALAGYRLADDERQLLYAQVSTDTGADRRVEKRETKAGLFGLLSPLTGGFGGDSGVARPPATRPARRSASARPSPAPRRPTAWPTSSRPVAAAAPTT